jgi:hypothetical protein
MRSKILIIQHSNKWAGQNFKLPQTWVIKPTARSLSASYVHPIILLDKSGYGFVEN